LPPSLLKIGAVLLMTSPFTPMLWMGEEWAASTPWPFFTSHPEPELAKATAEGRIEEFATHGWRREDIVDPQDPSAYHRAVLKWDEVSAGEHAEMLDFYKRLIRLRRENPALADPHLDQVSVEADEDARTIVVQRGEFSVFINLGVSDLPLTVSVSDIVFSTEDLEEQTTDVVSNEVTLPACSAIVANRQLSGLLS
jgi:maltooligosyltrehalose trehalohydrolase